MYVYFTVSSSQPMLLKIGKAKDPKKRMSELQTGNPHSLRIVALLKCKSDKHALTVERAAHRYFEFAAKRGEWFLYNKDIAKKIASWISRRADAYEAEFVPGVMS